MAEIVGTNQFRNGMHIELDGGVWRIVEFQHVKPGKGGAFVRTRVKNLDTGAVVDRTFRAGEKFPRVHTEVKNMQYLYESGDEVVFMDQETYEQTAVVAFNDGVPLYVDLPASVELTVSQTDPGVQGDRSTGGTKPATLETGAQISVPLFITTGEKVKVDTRTGDYMGRA